MSELKPRQFSKGEEAAWLVDKVCILGDYGKDAARILSKQADELKQLHARNAELERQLAEAEQSIEEAVKAEREACAKICDWASGPSGTDTFDCAEAIRARSGK